MDNLEAETEPTHLPKWSGLREEAAQKRNIANVCTCIHTYVHSQVVVLYGMGGTSLYWYL